MFNNIMKPHRNLFFCLSPPHMLLCVCVGVYLYCVWGHNLGRLCKEHIDYSSNIFLKCYSNNLFEKSVYRYFCLLPMFILFEGWCCFTFQVPKSAGASPDWSQEPRSQLRFPTGEKGPMPRSHLGPPKTWIIGKWKSGTKLRLTPGCAEWGVATPSSIETARPEAFKCAQRKIAKWACVRLSPRLSGYSWWPVLMLCIPAHLCFCHILKHCLNLPAQFCVDRNFQFYDHLSRFAFGFNDPCCFSAFIILISAVLWISFAYFASLGHGSGIRFVQISRSGSWRRAPQPVLTSTAEQRRSRETLFWTFWTTLVLCILLCIKLNFVIHFVSMSLCVYCIFLINFYCII